MEDALFMFAPDREAERRIPSVLRAARGIIPPKTAGVEHPCDVHMKVSDLTR
jgi:hypothetical protein